MVFPDDLSVVTLCNKISYIHVKKKVFPLSFKKVFSLELKIRKTITSDEKQNMKYHTK